MVLMMDRNIDQIVDVHCGDTVTPSSVDQFVLKPDAFATIDAVCRTMAKWSYAFATLAVITGLSATQFSTPQLQSAALWHPGGQIQLGADASAVGLPHVSGIISYMSVEQKCDKTSVGCREVPTEGAMFFE